MPEQELHISERLRKLLPALTKEERQQLKANIESDGQVTDPISFWHDGKRKVVIDGMNRWEIVRGTDIPFQTIERIFDSYDHAEIWILEHQLGRRNLLKPAQIRKMRGELYNRLKAPRGVGKHTPEPKGQNVTLTTDAAAKVAEKAGVSSRTVKRDGARVEALEGLPKAVRPFAESATDQEVKALGKMSETDQQAVARAVRVGQAGSIREAMKLTGAKPPKGKPKPPRQYPRSHWFKQWEQSIGPLVRLVDKIANEIGEKNSSYHVAVQSRLNDATEEMASWLT